MKKPAPLGVLGWVARIWSLLSIGFMLLFFFGEGDLRELAQLSFAEMLGFGCMGIMLVGMVVGWWREGWAALLVLGGLVAFYVLDIVRSGTPPSGPWFLLLAAPGALWAWRWIQSRRHTQPLG